VLQSETQQNATSEALKIHDYIALMQLQYPVIRCLSLREHQKYRSTSRLMAQVDDIVKQGDSTIMYGDMHDQLDGGDRSVQ
jgi:hypothetical protein